MFHEYQFPGYQWHDYQWHDAETAAVVVVETTTAWQDFLSDSAAAVLENRGVTVTYTNPAGTDTSLTAIFAETTGDGVDDEYSERDERKAYVDLGASTSIDSRGTFTHNSEVWQIKGPAGKDADFQSWRLSRTSKKSQRMTRGRR